VIRAGAADQHPAWIQQLDRAQVDLFVPASCRRHGGAAFGERRRIKNDRVKVFAGGLEVAQRIKNVCFAKLNILDLIKFSIAARGGDGFGGNIYGNNTVAHAGEL